MGRKGIMCFRFQLAILREAFSKMVSDQNFLTFNSHFLFFDGISQLGLFVNFYSKIFLPLLPC